VASLPRRQIDGHRPGSGSGWPGAAASAARPLLLSRGPVAHDRLSEAVHRALDVLVGGGLLALAAPVIAVAAIAVLLDSPGPILFRQWRLGMHGRPFRLLKLRTMVADADPSVHEDHVRHLIGAGAGGRPWAPIDRDPRVTGVGRRLRALGVDELPQLVNVLRGEMSLVGPRPAVPYEAESWSDWHRGRLAVKPGITGLWQVAGRGAADFETMMRMDLEYIDRRSPWLDLRILARTPAAVLRRRRPA
jgi:lipopolysaccharide/colanic/teichoic acid biosynthesis glycosyltransferase